MNNGIFCFIKLNFPSNNLKDWEKLTTQWDEFEWDDSIDYMISDWNFETVNEVMEELEALNKNEEIFFSSQYNSTKELIIKAYMDFDAISLYFIGLINIFRKAAEVGARGVAAFCSDIDWPEDPRIMYAFEVGEKGVFNSYILQDSEEDEDSSALKNFNKIWSDDIAKSIDKERLNK